MKYDGMKRWGIVRSEISPMQQQTRNTVWTWTMVDEGLKEKYISRFELIEKAMQSIKKNWFNVPD